MDYLTVREAGEKWDVGSRMAAYYCEQGRVPGAIKKGNLWLIPKDTPKPTDGRSLRYKKTAAPSEKGE
ncbi:DNA-binding protein [Lacrimispora amygdalina]|uniref:DNA-binding protein n=1 Tax=Lacrimispora amygdalina TaxID=253257 RepID=A0A3E2N8Z5_9FIRM|nr:DNA-binding protein [Clostridium indicum]RFZ77478.1 DNA-binding protein [Clostridium indicum]